MTDKIDSTMEKAAPPPPVHLTESMGAFLAMQAKAEMLLRSGLMPRGVDSVAKVITISLMGEALGMNPVIALHSINVIGDKASIPPQLMLALAYRSGQMEEFVLDVNDERAVCTVKKKGFAAHTETFSMDDAKKMKTSEGYGNNKREIPLSEKSNWKQQPKTMMKWRVIAAVLRVTFSETMHGMYSPEELGAPVVITENDGLEIDYNAWLDQADKEAAQLTGGPAATKDDIGNTMMSNGKARTAFLKKCLEVGVKSSAAMTMLDRAGKKLNEITYNEGMAIIFPPDPAKDAALADMMGDASPEGSDSNEIDQEFDPGIDRGPLDHAAATQF